jgi:macrolide-specific efflux system membrane fusion protein
MSQVFLVFDVAAAAQETGLLQSVLVKSGENVAKGQLLAQIDDRQAQLEKRAAEREREAAMARASDDIDVQFAIKSYELAAAEWQDAEQINERANGTVPRSEIRRLSLAKHRAELQISKSRLDMRVAKLNADVHQAGVEAAEEKIRRRQILAPFDGMIMDVLKQSREWVTSGDEVIRVVRMDRLRVEGLVSAADLDLHEIEGRQVTVHVALARGQSASLLGRVVFASPLIQAGNRLRVRAEVENRRGANGQWLLQPGKSARTVIAIR